MKCHFCNNETIITNQTDFYIYHHCETCMPFPYYKYDVYLKQNIELFMYSHNLDNSLDKPLYCIHLFLSDNITQVQHLIDQQIQSNKYIVTSIEVILSFNQIINISPSNFHEKLKTLLVFS